MQPTLVWYRRDLRTQDHEPLAKACSRGSVIPVFVLDDTLLFHPETAVARVEFLLHSLRALDARLRELGGRLLIERGRPEEVLPRLTQRHGCRQVLAHTDSERLVGRVRDARVGRALRDNGVSLEWIEPAGASAELQPYIAWNRQWHGAMAAATVPEPRRVVVPEQVPDTPIPDLRELGLCSDGKPIPEAGTAAALQRLDRFLEGPDARTYYWELSYPSAKVTSGLSPYLKFGVVSPRQCLQRLTASGQRARDQADRSRLRSIQQLFSRLRWGCSIHQRFRYLPQLELRSLWNAFDDNTPLTAEQTELYEAWKEGRTGFPIVDAAAHCLRGGGGWLELNFRSRAIYASFLSHLCGIDWRYGALHFMRHLIDGDCPIDHYQWAMQAGATYRGTKAWTRIYHPGQVAVNRCDPHGLFIRRWLPQLERLTNDQLGEPPAWADYPAPVLNYEQARQARLETLSSTRHGIGAIPLALARLPEDLTPFGSDRIAGSQVLWAQERSPELYPEAVDLDRLDQEGWMALLSWFSLRRSAETGEDAEREPRRPQASARPSRRSKAAEGQLSFDLS
ncbi:MAG: FAD-binding domain-containing protein [Synechococcus sp. WH 8007]|nr:FAD-binding domain-containing protein [Synechococcus sp. WH 8007]